MIRGRVAQTRGHDPDFTWRTMDVLRIENLSDIVFALALGILVSSSSAILTFADLKAYLLSIVPIAAGFALLVAIWNDHFLFFRRFALADGVIIVLNTLLLLVILYIAYPLRFAFDSLFGFFMLLSGQVDRTASSLASFQQAGQILGFFSIGYGAVYLIIAGMYGRVLKRAADLQLTARETALTRRARNTYLVMIAISAVVFVCGVFTPIHGFAGFLFFLIGPGIWLVESRTTIPAEEAAP